jgi:hypothetical protein
MSVFVDLFLMRRVHVIVRAVLARVIVAVVPGFSCVAMSVLVLVTVLVGVGVLVGVRVFRFAVPVFMLVGVYMLMRMQMLVFMVAVHCKLLSFGADVSRSCFL